MQEPPGIHQKPAPSAQPEPGGTRTRGGGFGDLRIRIVSGLALALATTALVWSGPWPFAVLVIVVAMLVAWEWQNIVFKGAISAGIWLISAGGAAAGIYLAITHGVLPACGVVALAAVVAFAFTAFTARDEKMQAAIKAGAGALYAGLPAVSLAWLRSGSEHGVSAIILLLLVVWSTDTGAYVFGRTMGGPKLWPRLSPKKTWSGLLGGVMTAAVV
ncbi:MAG: phosphatidate cytidylyltransferase, partial [Hyphomicrobiaceae bacterium]